MLLLIILFGSPRCSEFLWLSFLAEPLSQINPSVEYDHSRELAKKILMLLPLEMSYGSHLEPWGGFESNTSSQEMICLPSSLLYFPLPGWDSIYSHPIFFPLSQYIIHFVPSSLRCPKVKFVRELFPFCFLKAIWLKQVSKLCPCPGSGDPVRTPLLASQFSLPVSPLKCFSLPELFWVTALCFINMDMFAWELEKRGFWVNFILWNNSVVLAVCCLFS